MAAMHENTADARTLLSRIHDGKTTARTVVDHFLERIDARDAAVGAWAHVDPELARARADALDKAPSPHAFRGPLHGLPVGIKDVLLTRDMPTRYNCAFYKDRHLPVDAAAVALLRQAGAVILGKTETVELASIGAPPRTRNPHALQHTPGGSSSGSAAAVADGQVPVALGTQTGGSIIRPASFCGVWALKPTWGTVSTEGAKPFAPSLDTIGWFACSAADLALLLDVFDPAPQPAPEIPALSDARIGIWRTPGWHRAETATRDAMDAAIAHLARAGAALTELDPGGPFENLAAAHWTVMLKEGQRAFLAEYREAPGRIHPRIAEMARTGGGFSADDLRAAHDLAAQARARFDAMATGYDAILAPSTIAEAPQGLAATGDLLFNGLFTLLHVPCVNMPLFRAANGLPVGLTLTGPRTDDRKVIAMAEAIGRLVETGNDHLD
ncbi:amidase [Novosphingobium sp. BL-52-GroH]|uniref:amidase n=1 Tax=Novosphingobium sp. BL-52-GroH TaxID=3349877 RepID=UPI00384EF5D7